jgi:hypothetical protein
VLGLDEATGTGSFLGDDGARYRFERGVSRAGRDLQAGDVVDFTVDQRTAHREVLEVDLAAPGLSPVGSMGRRSLDVGRTIQRTFDSIRQNWAVFFGASALLVGLPSLLSAWGQSIMLTGDAGSAFLAVLIGGVLSVVGAYVLQGLVVQGTVSGFNGRRLTFQEALSHGTRVFLPLIGLAIVSGIAVMLGYILLIVPGVILTVIWLVAAPAVVVERRGVFESLQRSRDLTRGSRWPIFGVVVIYFVLWMIVGAAISALGIATGGTFVGGTTNMAVNLVATPLTNLLSGVIAAAGVAAVYYELRTVKEGVGAEQLAAIFD